MKKMNNKGFSLVELIVVVLIMAIIAVALAPQVMRWVENSRKSNDIEAYNALISAANVAGTDEAVLQEIGSATVTVSFGTTGTTFTTTSGTTTALVANMTRTLPELATATDYKTQSQWTGSAHQPAFTFTIAVDNVNGIKVTKTNAPEKDFS
jgi:type IV pilus assembly protein PilA